jgi:hypothetical protein
MELRPCLGCGHSAEQHQLIGTGRYRTHDGLEVDGFHLGFCLLENCACLEWDPDTLSHVSELLGLDVRQAIL